VSAPIRALAAALGLAPIARRPDRGGQPRGERAAGRVGAYQVFVGAERPSTTQLPVRVVAAQPRDLGLDVLTQLTGAPFRHRLLVEVDGLWLRGEGSRPRATALLAGGPGDRMRGLAHLQLEVDDRGVTAQLPIDDPLAELLAGVDRVIALAALLDDAAARVPVAAALAWVAPRFVAAAAALGLRYTPCGLGLSGVLDGCRVTTSLGADGGTTVASFHVELARPLGRAPAVHELAIDRRLGRVSVSDDQVVVAVALRRRGLPELTDVLGHAHALAHRLGGPPPAPVPTSPFR